MTSARALAALRPAPRIVGIAALGLAVCAAAVLGLGDGRWLTPPPASAAEQFMRALATHRWGPARSRLAAETARALDEAALEAAARRFEQRWGRIVQVEGREGPRSGDVAWASARLTTARGAHMEVPLPLRREAGVWRVTGLEGLTALP